jgi:hypothetical protein
LRCFNLRFETFDDDLDESELAAVALADGSQVWLGRHRGDPVQGTLAHVDTQTNLNAAREELIQALILTDDDFVWVSPLLKSSEPDDNAPHASTDS